MIEIISHIDANAVPCPGTAGHMSGKRLRGKITQVTDVERLKMMAATGCPVNKKVPTKMSSQGFKRACTAYREVAEKDRNRKNKYAISTPTGFKPNNRRMCLDCEVGEKVKEGEPFTPPDGITLITLQDTIVREPIQIKTKKKPKWGKPAKTRVTKEKSKTRRVKLTAPDVIRIRKMHAEGYSVPGLCEIFPVTTSTMYRVVNKESWKNV